MISEVFENQTLYLKNVLYYRGWVTQQDSNEIFQKMESFFTSANAKKDGNIVTVTNAVETKDGAPMMDIEIFIPLDKDFCKMFFWIEVSKNVLASFTVNFVELILLEDTFSLLQAYTIKESIVEIIIK